MKKLTDEHKSIVFIQNGEVVEEIEIPPGTPPIEERYHPDFVAQMVDVTKLVVKPRVGWLHDHKNGRFAEKIGDAQTVPMEPMVAGGVDVNAELSAPTDPRQFFPNAVVN